MDKVVSPETGGGLVTASKVSRSVRSRVTVLCTKAGQDVEFAAKSHRECNCGYFETFVIVVIENNLYIPPCAVLCCVWSRHCLSYHSYLIAVFLLPTVHITCSTELCGHPLTVHPLLRRLSHRVQLLMSSFARSNYFITCGVWTAQLGPSPTNVLMKSCLLPIRLGGLLV